MLQSLSCDLRQYPRLSMVLTRSPVVDVINKLPIECNTEINLSDWLYQVMWHLFTNYNVLLQRSLIDTLKFVNDIGGLTFLTILTKILYLVNRLWIDGLIGQWIEDLINVVIGISIFVDDQKFSGTVAEKFVKRHLVLNWNKLINWMRREIWSSGYGRRLISRRLCVRIPAPYSGWTFIT